MASYYLYLSALTPTPTLTRTLTLSEAELIALLSALPAAAGSRALVTSITNEMAMCHKDEDNQRRHAQPRPPLDPPAPLLSPSPGPTQGRAWPLQVTLTLTLTPTQTLTLTRYAYLRPLAAMWRWSDPTLRHVLGLPGWRGAWRARLHPAPAPAPTRTLTLATPNPSPHPELTLTLTPTLALPLTPPQACQVRASGLRTGEAAARGLRVKPPAELVLPAGADELVLDLALQVRLGLGLGLGSGLGLG